MIVFNSFSSFPLSYFSTILLSMLNSFVLQYLKNFSFIAFIGLLFSANGSNGTNGLSAAMVVNDSAKSNGEEGQILTRKASCEDVCDACTCSGSGSDNQCSINNDHNHHTHHDKLCPDIIPGNSDFFSLFYIFFAWFVINFVCFILFRLKGDEIDVEMCDESTMMMVIPNGHHHHYHHQSWLTGPVLKYPYSSNDNPANLVMSGTNRINYHLLNIIEGTFSFHLCMTTK